MVSEGENARAAHVRQMFGAIARRYDLMNRLMSLGQDQRWRQVAVELAAAPGTRVGLDVATGTADLALALAARCQRVVGVDFSADMLAVGQRKIERDQMEQRVSLVLGDALALPFPDGAFDCVTSGFAMRNVADPVLAFREMRRVVRPGGRVVCLELSPANGGFSGPAQGIYSRLVPLVGGLVSGRFDAYRYLPESVSRFFSADELSAIMAGVGLQEVGYRRLNFGTIAIHVGVA